MFEKLISWSSGIITDFGNSCKTYLISTGILIRITRASSTDRSALWLIVLRWFLCFFFNLKQDCLCVCPSRVEINKHWRVCILFLLQTCPIFSQAPSNLSLIHLILRYGESGLQSFFFCVLCVTYRKQRRGCTEVTNVSRWVTPSWLYIKRNGIKDSESRKGSAVAFHPLWR